MLLKDLTMIEFPTLKLILRQEISPKEPQSHYKMQSSTQKAGPSKDLLKISKIKKKEKKIPQILYYLYNEKESGNTISNSCLILCPLPAK